MRLMNYNTAEVVRDATFVEACESLLASYADGGAGVISVMVPGDDDGCKVATSCYVEGDIEFVERNGELGLVDPDETGAVWWPSDSTDERKDVLRAYLNHAGSWHH